MATVNQAVGAFSYNIQLGSSQYQLAFRWNTRFSFWTCDLYDANGNPLCTGRKVILNVPIFDEVNTVEGMPTVMLVPLDSTGQVVTIARGDLGNAVGIYAI